MTLQYLLKNFLDLKVELIHQNIKSHNTPQSYKLEQLLLNKHSAMNSIDMKKVLRIRIRGRIVFAE